MINIQSVRQPCFLVPLHCCFSNVPIQSPVYEVSLSVHHFSQTYSVRCFVIFVSKLNIFKFWTIWSNKSSNLSDSSGSGKLVRVSQSIDCCIILI